MNYNIARSHDVKKNSYGSNSSAADVDRVDVG